MKSIAAVRRSLSTRDGALMEVPRHDGTSGQDFSSPSSALWNPREAGDGLTNESLTFGNRMDEETEISVPDPVFTLASLAEGAHVSR